MTIGQHWRVVALDRGGAVVEELHADCIVHSNDSVSLWRHHVSSVCHH
jgi:hypothetical protein